MEMTVEQQRAMALANARRRAEEAGGGERDSLLGKVDSAVRGAADVLSFGLADEAAAGADALLNPLLGTGQQGETISDRYAKNLASQRATDRADAEERGGYRLAGQLAGGITGGAGLAKAGLSPAAGAIQRGAGLGRVAVTSAGEGAVLGGAQGFGSGEGGIGNRLSSAAGGAALGGAVGGSVPLAVSGISAATKPIVAPIASRIMPDRYAGRALAEAGRRAGMMPGDVARDLEAARAAGQDVFTVADALGNSGQRMLSTAARNPHDERQALAEFLQSRQAGQGRRVTGALADAFEAPDTAAQRAATLTAARDTAADAGYSAARSAAGTVDITPAIAKIDEVLAPGATGVLSPRSNIADDSVEAVLNRVRRALTDDKSNLSDFNAILRAKMDVDDMIGRATRAGAGNQARLLTGVKQEIDRALEAASAPYASARNAFREGSREIEAVDTGRQAAMRGRPADTIPAFQAMTPGQQAAFRAGYADPLIEAAQSAAAGTNKARPLISDATAAEFPAFAAPGQADLLGQRLAREARMFETGQAALGGSRTADNLADAADMAQFDPSVVSQLARGNIVGALMSAASSVGNNAKGMNPRVLERLTRALMETDPVAARAAMEAAAKRATSDNQRRAIINSMLSATGTAGAGRFPAP